MSGGWIDAVALLETADAAAFERILEQHVTSNDAIYWPEDHLIVIPNTDDDEALFRLTLPDWDTIGGIRNIGERGYLLPVHLIDEVQFWITVGLFEGTAALLTLGRLEFRDKAVFGQLDVALDTAYSSFVGERPQLCLA